MIPVPPLVLEELAHAFGTTSASLIRFGGGGPESDGIVYKYPYQAKPLLLKFIAIPLEDQRRGLLCLDERLRFVRFLGENKARIAFPLLSPQDNLYELFRDETHLWIGYSMDIAPGHAQPEKVWDERFFLNWGQTLGMIHRLTQQYPTWPTASDPENGESFLTWEEEWGSFNNWCQDEDVKMKWVEIKQELKTFPISRDAFGFVHNDPHIWNLRVDGDKITLLDFDVANYHWFASDIAIACQNILIFHSGGLNGRLRDRQKLLGFLHCFMEGYARENHLASEWLNHLDTFINYRRMLMFIVMYNWAKSQPRLHDTWKHLILSPPTLVGEALAR